MRYIFGIVFVVLLVHVPARAQDSLKTGNDNQKQGEKPRHGPRFVDENGDGFNDNAPDADGDGIPNGLDPDYQGQKKRQRQAFRDLDGDGIDDNIANPDENGRQRQIGPDGKEDAAQAPAEDAGQEKHQRRRGKDQP